MTTASRVFSARRTTALVVVAAHLALLGWLQRQMQPDRKLVLQNPAPPRIQVWLTPAVPIAIPRPEAKEPLAARAVRLEGIDLAPPQTRSARRAAPPTARGAVTVQAAVDEPAPAPSNEAEAIDRAAAAAPSASQAVATPWLDPGALRRAAREAALGVGSAAQLAVEAGAPMRARTAAQRLPEAIESSRKGDCAKGEFAGRGMGLLSLPFLAAAALGDECAR